MEELHLECNWISFITIILWKVVLTAAEKGMNGAVAKAVSIASNMEGGNAYILGQFDNPTNPKAHRYSTETSTVCWIFVPVFFIFYETFLDFMFQRDDWTWDLVPNWRENRLPCRWSRNGWHADRLRTGMSTYSMLLNQFYASSINSYSI